MEVKLLTATHSLKRYGVRIPYEHQLQRSLMMLCKAGFSLRQTKTYEYQILKSEPLKSTMFFSTLQFASDKRAWVLRLHHKDINVFDVKTLDIPFTRSR